MTCSWNIILTFLCFSQWQSPLLLNKCREQSTNKTSECLSCISLMYWLAVQTSNNNLSHGIFIAYIAGDDWSVRLQLAFQQEVILCAQRQTCLTEKTCPAQAKWGQKQIVMGFIFLSIWMPCCFYERSWIDYKSVLVGRNKRSDNRLGKTRVWFPRSCQVRIIRYWIYYSVTDTHTHTKRQMGNRARTSFNSSSIPLQLARMTSPKFFMISNPNLYTGSAFILWYNVFAVFNVFYLFIALLLFLFCSLYCCLPHHVSERNVISIFYMLCTCSRIDNKVDFDFASYNSIYNSFDWWWRNPTFLC